MTPKAQVRAARTGDVNLASAPARIDGVALVVNDRILLKNQSAPAQNGIYIFPGVGSALTRRIDLDAGTEFPGAHCFVAEGTLYAQTGWVCGTEAPVTLGVTAITFFQFSGAGTITASLGVIRIGRDILHKAMKRRGPAIRKNCRPWLLRLR